MNHKPKNATSDKTLAETPEQMRGLLSLAFISSEVDIETTISTFDRPRTLKPKSKPITAEINMLT